MSVFTPRFMLSQLASFFTRVSPPYKKLENGVGVYMIISMSNGNVSWGGGGGGGPHPAQHPHTFSQLQPHK
jgi:hypothetical protein